MLYTPKKVSTVPQWGLEKVSTAPDWGLEKVLMAPDWGPEKVSTLCCFGAIDSFSGPQSGAIDSFSGPQCEAVDTFLGVYSTSNSAVSAYLELNQSWILIWPIFSWSGGQIILYIKRILSMTVFIYYFIHLQKIIIKWWLICNISWKHILHWVQDKSYNLDC